MLLLPEDTAEVLEDHPPDLFLLEPQPSDPSRDANVPEARAPSLGGDTEGTLPLPWPPLRPAR